MLKDKKPSQVLAHLEGQGGKPDCVAECSHRHLITAGFNLQASGPISSLLGEGADSAIPAAALADALKTDTRTVRALVQRERLGGVPICALGRGYFLPGSVEELADFERSLSHRARETGRAAEAVRRVLDCVRGQLRLEEVLTDE